MLSISQLGSPSAAVFYFSSTPAIEYYSAGSSKGHWIGTGARMLGLHGLADFDELKGVLEGRRKTTEAVDGVGQRKARCGWDCTLSAPKSFSVLCLTTADTLLREKLLNAHIMATDRAIRLAEQHAAISRRGRGGARHELSQGLVACRFLHTTSRNHDPQIHSHVIVANQAPRQDGSWGALESSYIYKWKMGLGAAYRAELAHQLLAMGIAVEPDQADLFRIKGIPREVDALFSTRSQEIRSSAEQLGFTSAKAKEVAALRTRSAKTSCSEQELKARWTDQLQSVGFTPSSLTRRALHNSRILHKQSLTVSSVLRELTDRSSTFQRQDVYRVLAVHAQTSGIGTAGIEQQVQKLLKSDQTLTLQNGHSPEKLFTSQEMRNLETALVQRLAERQRSIKHQIHVADVTRVIRSHHPQLSEEQRQAVTHCCARGDLALVNGLAGTGKSAAMRAVKDIYQTQGYQVAGMALSAKAASSLEQGTGITSSTIHRFLNQVSTGAINLNKPTALVVDEAAMVGTRLMNALEQAVKSTPSKIILLGDKKQLQSIESGGIFNAALQTMNAVSLTQIRRQKHEWQIQTVTDFAQGNVEQALAALERRGHLHVEIRAHAMLPRIIEAWHKHFFASSKGQTVLIGATHRDVRTLNHAARSRLISDNHLSLEEHKDCKGQLWRAGDRILFRKNAPVIGVMNGELGTIRNVTPSASGVDMIVELDRGGCRHIPSDYAHCVHGYALTCHASQGITVEHAHVLLNESMSQQEWTYVAVSRARTSTDLYVPFEIDLQAIRRLSRSNPQKLSTEHEIDRAPSIELER